MNKIDKRTTVALSTIFIASILVVLLLTLMEGKPITWGGFGFIVAIMAGMFALGIVISYFFGERLRKNPRAFSIVMAGLFLFLAIGNAVKLIRNYMAGKSLSWFLLVIMIFFFVAGIDWLRRARLKKY